MKNNTYYKIKISETFPALDNRDESGKPGVTTRYISTIFLNLPNEKPMSKLQVKRLLLNSKIYQKEYGFILRVFIRIYSIEEITKLEYDKILFESDDWTNKVLRKPYTKKELKEWGDIYYLNYLDHMEKDMLKQ